jgi:RNA polymerase sigma-70 factor (ECF subfamily)
MKVYFGRTEPIERLAFSTCEQYSDKTMGTTDRKKPPRLSPRTEPSNRQIPLQGEILDRLLNYQSEFRAFLHRRLNDDTVVEDLFQQSLLRAVEQQHTLHNKESIVAWFYRVLRNALVDYYRARAAELRKVEGLHQELNARGEQAVPSPDEIEPTVCACLDRLLPGIRPAYAEVLRRIDLQGESPDTVAKDLQLTKNNLTVRLHRARHALRSALEASCGICTKHGCLNCTCE